MKTDPKTPFFDFTYAMYDFLLSNIVKAGYRVGTVKEYLAHELTECPFLILRHDVEWNPQRALDIAKLESGHKLKATYYFRADTKVFNPLIMRTIQDLGCEIGYHFEVLDQSQGNFQKAIQLFEEEIDGFRKKGITIDTVCSHGNPRIKKRGYKANNEIFLYDQGLKKKTGILGEAYLDIDFSEIGYFSDVSLRWKKVNSTKNLVSIILRQNLPRLYLLTHPDYWSKTAIRSLTMRGLSQVVHKFKLNEAILKSKEAFKISSRF